MMERPSRSVRMSRGKDCFPLMYGRALYRLMSLIHPKRAHSASSGAREAVDPHLDLSIVVPVYRSAQCLERLVAAIGDALVTAGLRHEIILVNDGSPDESWAVIERLAKQHHNVIGIDLRRNFGQDNALLTGIRETRGEYVALMDDDLQHDPRDLPHLLLALQPGFDVVYADFRKRHHRVWKRLGSWFNGKVAEWVLQKPRHIYLSSYKVMRHEVAEAIGAYSG